MIKTLALGAALAALATAAVAQPYGPPPPRPAMGPGMAPPPGGPAPHAPEFVRMAGQSDQFEVQEGRLASMRARDPRVRRFAAEMVRAHTMTTRDLMKAVRKTGRTPPPPPPLRPDQMQKVADLRGMHGRDFDRAYIDQQVDAHQEALSLMMSYGQGGEVPPLREAAEKTAPLVQRHLDMARGIQSSLR